MVRCEPISLFAAPSTVHWLSTEGEPLNEISTPENKPLFLLSKLSPTAAPGTSVVNCTKFRPFRGNSRTCWPSMMFDTSPFSVLTWTGEASTVTVSEAAPTCIVTLSVVTSATCSSTFFSVSFLKPGLFTVMVYVPASSSGNEKLPCSLVVVVRLAPVRSLTTVTDTPGTTAPLGSVTVPVIVPVNFCACVVSGRQSARRNTHRSASFALIITVSPSCFFDCVAGYMPFHLEVLISPSNKARTNREGRTHTKSCPRQFTVLRDSAGTTDSAPQKAKSNYTTALIGAHLAPTRPTVSREKYRYSKDFSRPRISLS